MGILVALVGALVFIALQKDAIDRGLPAAQRDDQLAAHLNREIAEGPLLLLESGGATCAALAWATSRMARRVPHPYRQGGLAGTIVAGVVSAIALRLMAPLVFIVPLAGLILGASLGGVFLSRKQTH